MAQATQKRRVIPGFGLTLGYSLAYLALVVLIPLSALVLKATTMTWERFGHVVTDPQVVAAYKLSFGASLISALVNAAFGLLVAWVLARYRFPGKKLVDEGGSFLERVVAVAVEFNVLCSMVSHILCPYHCLAIRS